MRRWSDFAKRQLESDLRRRRGERSEPCATSTRTWPVSGITPGRRCADWHRTSPVRVSIATSARRRWSCFLCRPARAARRAARSDPLQPDGGVPGALSRLRAGRPPCLPAAARAASLVLRRRQCLRRISAVAMPVRSRSASCRRTSIPAALKLSWRVSRTCLSYATHSAAALYDEAVEETRVSLDRLNRELAETEILAEPLRRRLQSRERARGRGGPRLACAPRAGRDGPVRRLAPPAPRTARPVARSPGTAGTAK